MTTLREACIARGIDPDKPGYKVPPQRLLNIDRIIPGVPDRESPAMHKVFKDRRGANPRKMYTRRVAEMHRTMIAEGGVAAYVALFCQLNNLKEHQQ